MARNLGGRDQRELTVKFKVVKFLGKGSYGSVFQVQRLTDGQTYALKEMDVRSMSQAEREDSVNEVRLLASVSHPNVIAYNEAFLDGNRLCIIMEYAPDGDLSKVIKKWQMMKRPMPEDLIWKLFIQVARGLAALHNMKILHRDIKPGNIMVMQGDIAKIGDLGIAKLLTSTLAAKTQIGTPHYMPPEIWKNKPYSFSSDIWALGCLLYEMATFSVPFEARSMNELRYKVLKGTFPAVPGTYSKELANMVRDCLDQTPERRPTVERMLASPIITSKMHLLSGEARQAPPSTAGSVLINTIKVPRGNFAAIKGKLPPANYASDVKDIIKGGGFGAIMEGDEGNAEVMEVHKLPAIPQPVKPQIVGGPMSRLPPSQAQMQIQQQQQQQRQQQQQQLQQQQAAAVAAAQARLPPMPNRPQPYGVAPPPAIMAPVQGAYNMQPRGQPVVSQVTPSAVSQAGSRWPKAPGVGSHATPVSESHAAYGAFYHNSPKNAAPLQVAKQRAFEAYQAAQQGKPQWGNNEYPNPYMANRPPPGVGGAPRLPAIPQVGQRQPQLPPAAPQAQAKALPPWNYGVGAGARAAAAAYAAQLRAAQQASPQPAMPEVARYPPPQWQARPARY